MSCFAKWAYKRSFGRSFDKKKLKPAIVEAKVEAQRSIHQHLRDFQTCRVQLELKVGSREKSDLVVFRDRIKPVLSCWAGGPTDVVAKVDPRYVEAVIELKAAPSKSEKQRVAFAGDVEKLHRLRTKHPHIQCYFVLVDKAVSVPGATCDPWKPVDETWHERPNRQLRATLNGPNLGFVEVWDLTCDRVPTPRQRFSL